MFRLAFRAVLLASPGLARAQDAAAQHGGQHGGMHHMPGMSHPAQAVSADAGCGALTEGGRCAFAAIQEVVSHRMAGPATDWSRVAIEALAGTHTLPLSGRMRSLAETTARMDWMPSKRPAQGTRSGRSASHGSRVVRSAPPGRGA